MTQRALIILHPDFEEMEAVAPIDLLARAGIEVVQASTSGNHLVKGRSGITLEATHLFSDVAKDEFDAVILPGGPGIDKLRNDACIITCLRRHNQAGRLVAVICAAPLLLKDAKLVDNIEYTAHPCTDLELADACKDAVVVDGPVVTARGAGTATEFALAIVHSLCGEQCARQIAASICWPHPL